MAKTLIASKLIDSVRERAMLPDDNYEYGDETILNTLNDEMDTGILPDLLKIHEEHLVTYLDVDPHEINETGYRYIIPSKAIGSKLRDAGFIVGNKYYELSRVSLGEISDYKAGYSLSQLLGVNLFYIQGDEIVVLNPSQAGTFRVRMYFHLRPNEIVLEKNCAKIINIDRETGTLQLQSVDKSLSDLSQIDFIQGNNPNKILTIDKKIDSINVNTRTIRINPEYIPSRLKEGDWVARTGESPFPNIPLELHKVLAQAAAVKILGELGDTQNYSIAKSELDKMVKSVMGMMDDRVEGAPRKIKNRSSTLNSTGFFKGRRRRGY